MKMTSKFNLYQDMIANLLLLTHPLPKLHVIHDSKMHTFSPYFRCILESMLSIFHPHPRPSSYS